VGTVKDWCLRELMDSLLCLRLFGWTERDDTLLQLGLAFRLAKLTAGLGRGRKMRNKTHLKPCRALCPTAESC
jgi:hypothetical protein